ncbi:MAG: polyphosphate kinase 2 [Caulobacterales bacterium]
MEERGNQALTKEYRKQLRDVQIGLVRYQQWAIGKGEKALVLFEGRDGAGKDGTITRIHAHLTPRNTRIAALPKPSDRDRSEWYFQRYVRHLPAAGELVLFNRSWYNRAGVEPVMGYCTAREHADFLRDVPAFERMLEEAEIHLVKIWLDISKAEQGRRLDTRRTDPLKALKVSDLDAVAQKRWKDYSKARNQMLMATHTPIAPWICVHTDDKKLARINVIRHLLRSLAPDHIARDYDLPDARILFPFREAALTDGRLEK